MRRKLFSSLMVGWIVLSGEASAVGALEGADIKIVFTKPFVAPPQELPKDVLYPPGGDFREHGTLTKVAADRVSTLSVTWMDPRRFKSEQQVQDLLRELLSSTATQTWTYHVWSYGDAEPNLVATVEHSPGKQGKLLVWCAPSPGLYFAYQDGGGKWWWGQWDVSKAPNPGSLEP